jgi:hypothetical protein
MYIHSHCQDFRATFASDNTTSWVKQEVCSCVGDDVDVATSWDGSVFVHQESPFTAWRWTLDFELQNIA